MSTEAQYSLDEMNPPKWIDKSFFQKVLQKSECNETIHVKCFEIGPATKPGDHFTSVMFRAQVKYSYRVKVKNNMLCDEQVSLIIKTPPFSDTDGKRDAVDTSIFDTEIKMYTVTLPEIRRLMELAGEKNSFSPRLYYQSKDPHTVIVLEDLLVQNLSTISKELNWQDTKIAIDKLARFHAASYFMEYDRRNMHDYNISIFDEGYLDTLDFLVQNLRNLTEIVATWPGYEKHTQKLQLLEPEFLTRICSIFQMREANFNVLNHGDFHLKNMMARRNESGSIEELYLVDFQACLYGSPAIDLIYLLYTVASNETRCKYRAEIIMRYYKTFAAMLQDVGYIGKIPSLLDLNTQLLQNGFLEVFLAICFLPYMFVDLTKVNIEKLYDSSVEGEAMKTTVYNSAEYQELLKKLLNEFLHKGLLG